MAAPSSPKDAPLTFMPTPSSPKDAPLTFMPTPLSPKDASLTFMPAPLRPKDAPLTFMPTPFRLKDAPLTFMPAPFRLKDAPLTFMPTPLSYKGAPLTFMPAPFRLKDAPMTLEAASFRYKTARPLLPCAPVDLASPSAPLVPPPANDPPAPAARPDASLPANDATAPPADEAPPPSGVTLGRVRAALVQFLASREKKQGADFIRSVITRKLGPVHSDMMDELVHLATVEALQAQSPPWTVGGIPAWVARVTRRQIAQYFERRADDEENIDPNETPDEWHEHHAPATDWGAREHLICKWLEQRIGPAPRRRETFRLILEHEIAGRSLEELAVEQKTTKSALANRFLKLRKELAPQVALMDQEKPRRAVLLALFFFGACALVALVYLLVHLLLPPPAPAPGVLHRQAAPTGWSPFGGLGVSAPAPSAPIDAGAPAPTPR